MLKTNVVKASFVGRGLMLSVTVAAALPILTLQVVLPLVQPD